MKILMLPLILAFVGCQVQEKQESSIKNHHNLFQGVTESGESCYMETRSYDGYQSTEFRSSNKILAVINTPIYSESNEDIQKTEDGMSWEPHYPLFNKGLVKFFQNDDIKQSETFVMSTDSFSYGYKAEIIQDRRTQKFSFKTRSTVGLNLSVSNHLKAAIN